MLNQVFKMSRLASYISWGSLLASSTLVLPLTVQANENPTESSALPSMVVVANPLIEGNSVDEFSTTAMQITDEQIQNQNSLDLASALRVAPGIQISRFNPVGSFGGAEGGGVYIRGLGSSRPGSEIKTYIDGIPFYMGMWNHPLLDLLPLNGMQSVSVYKSPKLHVNGNNFASINLTTKGKQNSISNKENRNDIYGKLTAGEFSTVTQQFNLEGQTRNTDYMIAQGYSYSDGHRDNADGELKNIMGRVGQQISTHWHTNTFYLNTQNLAHDPFDDRTIQPNADTAYETKATMLAVSLEHDYPMIQGSFKLYRNEGNGDLLEQANSQGDTLSYFDILGARWKEQLNISQLGQIIVGVDYDELSGELERVNESAGIDAQFRSPTFELTSPYIAVSQGIRINDAIEIIPSLGARYYQHNQFKDMNTSQAGLSVNYNDLTVYANFAIGGNYPGLDVTTLAYLIPALGETWQKLEAETLDHKEIGIKYAFSAQTGFDLTAFEDHIENRYIFAFPPHVNSPQFMNLGSYNMRGGEFTLNHTLSDHWNIFTGITLLDADIEDLPYSPEEAITLGSNGRIGRFSISMDAQYQSKTQAMTDSSQSRTGDGASTETVAGFTVVNFRLAYGLPSLGKKGEVFLNVENALDRDYGYRPGYPMPGAWAQIGFSANL